MQTAYPGDDERRADEVEQDEEMKIFLIVVILTGGHGSFKSSTEMVSMSECLKVLAATKIVIPNGDENEGRELPSVRTRTTAVGTGIHDSCGN